MLRFTILAVRVGGRSSSPLAELHVAQHHTRQPEAATRPRQSRRRSPGPPPTTTTTTARAGPSPLPRTLARSRLSAAPCRAAVAAAHQLPLTLRPHSIPCMLDPVSGILQFSAAVRSKTRCHTVTQCTGREMLPASRPLRLDPPQLSQAGRAALQRWSRPWPL